MPSPHCDDLARQIAVASGYCDLGMWLEANEAVEDIAPAHRLEVPVLLLRERIYRALGATDLHETMVKLLDAAREVAAESGQTLVEEV